MDRHLGRINTEKHQNELMSKNTRLVKVYRTGDIPASDGCHIVVSKMAVGLGVSSRYRSIFEEHQ